MTMLSALFVLTAALYAGASIAFGLLLVKGDAGRGVLGRRCLAGGALGHLAFLTADFLREGATPLAGIQETLTVTALLIAVAFLLVTLWRPVTVLGAFITPVTLLFFLGGGIGHSVPAVPEHVRSVLLPVHITVNTLGVAAFALAFGVAIAYVVQERLLRRRRLGGLFQRLPPLDVLDATGFKLVMAGFPLLTVGLATGTAWAVQHVHGGPTFSTAQIFGMLAWIVFAAVLLLRVAVGWRGKRAAIGTILGFLCAAAVMVTYLVRSVEGSV